MKLKRIASAFLAGALALSLAACGGSASTSAAASASGSAAGSTSSAAGSDLDYIKGKGKMVIGYTVYEPMNYTDADGNFTGFDTELATAVCAKLGVEPEFVEINWDTKVVELDAKSIDCIWNGMTLPPCGSQRGWRGRTGTPSSRRGVRSARPCARRRPSGPWQRPS